MLLHARGESVLASVLSSCPPHLLIPSPALPAVPHPPDTSADTSIDAAASAPAPAAAAGGSGDAAASELEEEGTAAGAVEKLALALGLLLKAESAFQRVAPHFLDAVDNVARLHLAIVWCYLLRAEVDRLPEAAHYLRQARSGLERAHGRDLSRLIALKGAGAAERALYVRLRLCEGVVQALEGDLSGAGMTLLRAQAERAALAVAEEEAMIFCGLYTQFTAQEAMPALRAARCAMLARGVPVAELSSDALMGEALDVACRIAEKREAKRVVEEAAQRHRDRQERCGATASGLMVDLDVVDSLMSMGVTEQQAVWGARQADNNTEVALNAIFNAPEGFSFPWSDGEGEEEEEEDEEEEEGGAGEQDEEALLAAAIAESLGGSPPETTAPTVTVPVAAPGEAGDASGTDAVPAADPPTVPVSLSGTARGRAPRGAPRRRIDGARELLRSAARAWDALGEEADGDLPDYTLALEGRLIDLWLARVQ